MEEKAFLLHIDSIFHICGRGTVVTGRVQEGSIKQYDELEIVADNTVIKTRCMLLEKYQKIITEAHTGEYIAVYLENVSRTDIPYKAKLIRKR